MASYPLTYSDAHGSEVSTLENDGTMLRVRLRGVEFIGHDLDGLEPEPETPLEALATFRLHHNCLCSCRIGIVWPIALTDQGQIEEGMLWVRLLLGDPGPNGGLLCVELRLALEYSERQYAGSGTSGWFEDELLDIQRQLPEGLSLRACITCQYSDYSPFGQGMFGGMMCFRNIKERYLQVQSKHDLIALLGESIERVQETYLCPEFATRLLKVGYRGGITPAQV